MAVEETQEQSPEGRYSISADELHARIVADLRGACEHQGWDMEHILEGHERRPLEQTLCMLLISVYHLGQKRLQ